MNGRRVEALGGTGVETCGDGGDGKGVAKVKGDGVKGDGGANDENGLSGLGWLDGVEEGVKGAKGENVPTDATGEERATDSGSVLVPRTTINADGVGGVAVSGANTFDKTAADSSVGSTPSTV